MTAPFSKLQASFIRREQHQENAGRDARFTVTYETIGTGELLPVTPIEFDTPFFHEPTVSYGHHLVLPPLTRQAGSPEENMMLPLSTGGVFRWVHNERRWWTGAFLYFRVMADFEARIIHCFAFTAQSYKPMSDEVNAGLYDDRVTPLTPPVIP